MLGNLHRLREEVTLELLVVAVDSVEGGEGS